jgi:hypothetical protein
MIGGFMTKLDERVANLNREQFLRISKMEEYKLIDDVRAITEPPHPAVNLYHGTRRRESPEEIKKHGITTFDCTRAYEEMLRALEHFNKLHVLGEKSSKGTLVRDQLGHVCRFDTKGFYVDAIDPDSPEEKEWFGDNRVCSYARNNPETISLILWYAGVPREKIREYLREKYGKPYMIKLKQRLLIPEINLPTYTRRIEPSDIEDIIPCPDE